MSNNNHCGRSARAVALFLVFACVLVFCGAGIFTWADEYDAGKSGKIFAGDCSLTVFAADPASEMAEDIKYADVVIDIYRVADAISDPLYDTYSFRLTDDFAELTISDDMDRDKWNDLAREAAMIVASSDPEAAVEGAPSDGRIPEAAEDSLSAGLYLIIARDADLTDKDDYFKTPDTGIVSMANSDLYTYYFAPQLVSLPGKGDLTDMQAVTHTSDRQEWKEDVTVYLKPERDVRLADIIIVKTLNEYIGPTDAVFVFSITAETGSGENTKQVFSRVVMMSFNEAGTKSITLKQVVPAGASVTVTEIYEGAYYELVSSDDMPVIASADDPAELHFVNEPTEDFRGGGGIVNRFTKSENEDWQWQSIDDESDAATGGNNNERP